MNSTGLRYMGGKHFLKDYIIEKLDYNKTCYIELFGGAAHVLLHKPPHKVGIYNDIYGDLVNFFTVIKEKYDEFMKETEWDLYSEELWKRYKKELEENKELSDVKRAHYFYYVLACSFSGSMRSFSYGFEKSTKARYFNQLKKIKVIHERLKNVIILNKDFREVLNSAKNKSDVIVYADPPYYDHEYYYKGNFSRKDHEDLARLLNECKGDVILSYYFFEGIEDLYPKHRWNYETIKVPKHGYGITKNSKKEKKPIGEELLITNFENKQKKLIYL
jgi:DNA adenine methylase